jgi:hypothetical protein
VRKLRMKLVHIVFAVVTLASVAAIAIAGPSQAGGARDLYLPGAVAS